mmetsp:Transcript_76406/g.247886  ORF Transcript_76406/g.247886 Transcript_76406/m.247886 type:complete len:101 (-) Transcript_76406:113-415(-)
MSHTHCRRRPPRESALRPLNDGSSSQGPHIADGLPKHFELPGRSRRSVAGSPPPPRFYSLPSKKCTHIRGLLSQEDLILGLAAALHALVVAGGPSWQQVC